MTSPLSGDSLDQKRGRLRFPKAARLLSSKDYRRIRSSGKKREGSFLYLEIRIIPSLSKKRLGLTVSRKYGKANERNLFKRRIREIFRLHYSTLPAGLEVNVHPKRAAKAASFADLQADFLSNLCKL